MAVDRPTFHEAWYRVANLRPRLLAGVRVHRQHFRASPGTFWTTPPASTTRGSVRRGIGSSACSMAARTVSEVWSLCNEQLGDRAPTQGEVIQLLGQLHAPTCCTSSWRRIAKPCSPLPQAHHPQVQNYLMNLLFLRIPLLDPNRFLDRWVGISAGCSVGSDCSCGWRSSGRSLLHHWGHPELLSQSEDVLDPSNLVFLYLSFIVLKILHEFSHAFACKRFGGATAPAAKSTRWASCSWCCFLCRTWMLPAPGPFARSGTGPSSAWPCLAELAAASVAAIVWSHTSTGRAHHRLQRHLRRQRLDGPVQRQPLAGGSTPTTC